MPAFKQGDVVRVPFPYTDRSTRQHRPALVVSTGGIGENGNLLWVVMITSAENRTWPGDLAITRYEEAGLPAPSIIRPCKIATIEARHAERLGRIKPRLMIEVLSKMRSILGS
ncbi:type II toxin-antitoxin system PemK/MazF family toxin [Bradyrhizobium japonicum]|uniref:type II toxin-antitoxin system PemK/MazF family toxin n=1 Tax=Bradyrhizobium japonicum TaxID=375 RepID=UPI001BA5CB5B|nr:type II toxin-antitoxin system PemK/MazF family toxin [Bradyrhizobium japonicum]MBR0734988.1 type II toxin-antitoxin system PemK/MazF family toxin [Bradyrhizobium japonicum]MBR0809462.1 type II toxin-antitoxin system PemK/MazF family toxin [Bradyrhizobium japonicum]